MGGENRQYSMHTSLFLYVGNFILFCNRRMAGNGFAPPLGNFADISYLVEN